MGNVESALVQFMELVPRDTGFFYYQFVTPHFLMTFPPNVSCLLERAVGVAAVKFALGHIRFYQPNARSNPSGPLVKITLILKAEQVSGWPCYGLGRKLGVPASPRNLVSRLFEG